MEEKVVYDSFKTNQWNRLSQKERFRLLQKVECIQAKKQGRQAVKLVFDKDLAGFGAYSLTHQTIIVGREAVEPNGYKRNTISNEWEYFPANYEALDTIIHEGHHREQDLLVRGSQSVLPFLQGELRQEVAHSWQKNFRNYGSPSNHAKNRTSFEEYYFQPIEFDTVERTYQEMVWNNYLYQEQDFRAFLSKKSNSMESLRIEALKTYGPNYQKKLEELQRARERNPRMAARMESEYRKDREQYERENCLWRER